MMDKGNMTNKISKPTHFYKYRNFDKYTERMFVNYEFYFPKASEFNDPFDCNVPVSFSGGRREDYRKLLADILPIYFEQSGLSLNDEQIKASVEDHLDEQLSNLPEFSRQLRAPEGNGTSVSVRSDGIGSPLCVDQANPRYVSALPDVNQWPGE